MTESTSAEKVLISMDRDFVESMILSDDSKKELQNLCPGIEWVEDEDVLKKFRCQKCERIVVSYSVTLCGHLFCEPCLGPILQGPCPVVHCSNEAVQRGKPNVQLEMDLCQLKAKCIWRNFGCQQVVPLRNFLDHRVKCPVFTEKICPSKERLPDHNNVRFSMYGEENSTFTFALKQLEIKMQQYYHDVREHEKVEMMRYFDDEIGKKLSHQKMDLSKMLYSGLSEDLISWHRETEKKLTDKLTTVVNESMMDLEMRNRRHLQEDFLVHKKEFETFATDAMKTKVENLKTELIDQLGKEVTNQTEMDKEELRSHFSDIIETNLQHYKNKLTDRTQTEFHETFQSFSDDFLKSMESQLSTKFEVQYSELFRSLSHRLKEDSKQMETDMLMKLTQDLTRKLDGDLNTWSNYIATKLNEELEVKVESRRKTLEKVVNEGCIKELQMKTDELSKEVIGKQEAIAQEMDRKIKECSRATDQLKTEMKDSLNRKMESKDVKRTLFQPYKNPSFRGQWVEWALEERRTEFVWKVPRVRSLLQRWKKEGKGHLLSEVFVTKEFGFKIRAKLEYYALWMHWSIEFEEEEEATPTRPSVYLHRTTFVLMDQSEGNGPKKDIVRIKEPTFDNWEVEEWMKIFSGGLQFSSMRHLEGGAPYVVDDVLCIRILIEPLSVLWKSFASNDGTLLWRIDDYSQKKKDSLEGVIEYLYSDYFYSSPRGYRMKIQLRIDSDGDLGMWAIFLRGEWDDDLGESFPHKTTLTILDRSDSEQKNHLILTIESDLANGDWMGGIPLSQLESGPYLKDDRLMVKVVVEPK